MLLTALCLLLFHESSVEGQLESLDPNSFVASLAGVPVGTVHLINPGYGANGVYATSIGGAEVALVKKARLIPQLHRAIFDSGRPYIRPVVPVPAVPVQAYVKPIARPLPPPKRPINVVPDSYTQVIPEPTKAKPPYLPPTIPPTKAPYRQPIVTKPPKLIVNKPHQSPILLLNQMRPMFASYLPPTLHPIHDIQVITSKPEPPIYQRQVTAGYPQPPAYKPEPVTSKPLPPVYEAPATRRPPPIRSRPTLPPIMRDTFPPVRAANAPRIVQIPDFF